MKNLVTKFIVVSSLAFVGPMALASGFQCDSGNGFNVKLFNRLDATRTPAALIVAHKASDPATLLKAYNEEIHKYNRENTVQYVVDGASMQADKVILQIAFKEGRETLENGEHATGQLIVVDEQGRRDVHELDCFRYLKGE